jgi:hypothetical protein
MEIEELLSILKKGGIEFFLICSMGNIILDSEEILLYLANPTKYLASRFEVSEKIWLSFGEYHNSNYQCRGITKRNRQCKNQGEKVDNLKEFVENSSDRCRWHKV